MRIGIITFWYSNENYGQLLQAYALQNYLKDKGHEAFIIKYDKNKASAETFKTDREEVGLWSIIKKMLRKFRLVLRGRPKIIDRRFDEFRNEFLQFSSYTYESYEDLKTNYPNADVYITGSDQVWNYVFIGNPAAFFLQFGSSDTKRIAYAASIGHKELPHDIFNLYKGYLKDFDAIGVRESSGVELCKKMGYQETKLMPDPTLLLEVKEWDRLISTGLDKSKTDKCDIFIYTLGNRPLSARDQLVDHVKKLANKTNMHVSINKDFSGDTFPAIQEWLRYVKNANVVLTNSFHGVVFSIIFNVKFIAIASGGKTKGMNERIESLLDRLELSQFLVFDYDTDHTNELLSKEIAWSEVNEKIASWRREASEFLDFR